MDAMLIHVLVGVIVFAVIIAVISLLDRSGWLPPPIGRIAMIVIGALFFIWLLVDVLVPLIHVRGPLL